MKKVRKGPAITARRHTPLDTDSFRSPMLGGFTGVSLFVVTPSPERFSFLSRIAELLTSGTAYLESSSRLYVDYDTDGNFTGVSSVERDVITQERLPPKSLPPPAITLQMRRCDRCAGKSCVYLPNPKAMVDSTGIMLPDNMGNLGSGNTPAALAVLGITGYQNGSDGTFANTDFYAKLGLQIPGNSKTKRQGYVANSSWERWMKRWAAECICGGSWT